MNKQMMALKKRILEVLDSEENKARPTGPTSTELVSMISNVDGFTIKLGMGAIQCLEEMEEIFLSNGRWYAYPEWLRPSSLMS